jgi:competence protein ComK
LTSLLKKTHELTENKNYQVTAKTMALLPIRHLTYQSIIYDWEGIFYSSKSVKQLLNEACLERGSSYKGRLEAARKLMKQYKKTPLIICPFEKIYAFPTKSPDAEHCMWIFPQHIENYNVNKQKEVELEFKNACSLVINCSEYIYKNQKGKAADLLLRLSRVSYILL